MANHATDFSKNDLMLPILPDKTSPIYSNKGFTMFNKYFTVSGHINNYFLTNSFAPFIYKYTCLFIRSNLVLIL